MKPKLLIFINSLRYGGAERVVSHLLEHLKNDFEIHLALFSRGIDYHIPPEIKIFNLKQPEKESAYIVFAKIPYLSYKLYRYCKKNNIKSSVAFLNRPCYINALMRFLWGFKGNIVMCERTHQSTRLELNSTIYGIVSKALVKFSYKRADLVLANSYAMKADLIENFRIRTPIRVIYNPIDLTSIKAQSQLPPPFTFEKGTYYFIAVGGFRIDKNFPLLLQAFFILKNLPVNLIIVGGGELDSMIRRMISTLGIQDKVILCGFDINPFKYMSRSNCFVLSSFVEGFPNVLLEALACGLPIISTDCKSGPRELLAPGSDLNYEAFTDYKLEKFGILTPVNDVAILAAAMKRMYEDKPLSDYYSSKALSRAAQYDIEEIRQYFHVAFSP